jgi:hypothetical protein
VKTQLRLIIIIIIIICNNVSDGSTASHFREPDVTWKDDHGDRVMCNIWKLENRVLRIFGPKRDEVTGSGENFIMRSSMFCTPHPLLCR